MLKSVLFKKIFLGVVCSLMGIAGAVSYFAVDFNKWSIAKATTFYTVNGEDVKIDIYAREIGEEDDSPTFAVGDTIMKAIEYKKANLNEDVSIDFAVYRMYYNTGCYYKPNTVDYGRMTNLNVNETRDCIRISYAMVKAALWGIKTNFIFHIDNDKTIPYFQEFMEERCYHDNSKKVKDYLTVRRATWDLDYGGTHQMHSKQLLVSDYIDHDGKVYHNAVWSSSANVDQYASFSKMPIDYKDWSHSGFMISGNSEIYRQNKLFFDVTFKHWNDRELFAEEIMDLRADGELKYADDKVEFYFTPMTRTHPDAWDIEENPVARYLERLTTCQGEIDLHISMYSLGESTYSDRMVDCIVEAFGNNTNPNNEFGLTVNKPWTTETPSYKTLINYGDVKIDIKTHAKDYIFYFGDTDEYIVVTGSMNHSIGEYLWKANQIAVFKEQGDEHPIYDAFLANYKAATESKNALDKLG